MKTTKNSCLDGQNLCEKNTEAYCDEIPQQLNPEANQQTLVGLAGSTTPLRNEMITKVFICSILKELIQEDESKEYMHGDNETLTKLCDKIWDEVASTHFKYGELNLTVGELNEICQSMYNRSKIESRLDVQKMAKNTKRILNNIDNGCYMEEVLCDTNDAINEPIEVTRNYKKYIGQRQYDPLDVIEDWGLGFCDGSALEYISLFDPNNKNKTIEYIDKAILHLNRLKQNLLSK